MTQAEFANLKSGDVVFYIPGSRVLLVSGTGRVKQGTVLYNVGSMARSSSTCWHMYAAAQYAHIHSNLEKQEG